MQDGKVRSLEVLEAEQVKSIENIVEKNYGAVFDLKQFLVMKTPEEKIWIASKAVADVDFSSLSANSVGMYFGKLKRNNKINLSTEGCQMVGKEAKKNVAVVDKDSAERFLRGNDVIPIEAAKCENQNFVILKCGEDFLGSSLFVDGKISNILPKSRRLLDKSL